MNVVLTTPQPADFAAVRATNLAMVLRHVRAAAPCSRAEIAASTGLNKGTVSSLVASLIERRILREIGRSEHRVGRPATMLAIDGSGYVGIGVEVGADHLTAVAVDLAGRRVLTWRRSFSTVRRSPGRVIAEVAELVRRATVRIQAARADIVGLGVAIPGQVDSAGVVRAAPALGWAEVELRTGLEQALGGPEYPVGVDNDAALGAAAEHRYGAFAGTAHLAYLAGPPGCGVGVITAGVPLRGANGYGGDIGRLRVRPGVDAFPDAGCFDAAAELGDLLRRTGTDPRHVVAWDVEIDQIAQRARLGEQQALTALAELGSRLGYAIGVLMDLLNPAVVLLGGYYAPLAPWLLPAVEREIGAPTGGALLAASMLGYEAAALGGAAVPLDAVEAAFP